MPEQNHAVGDGDDFREGAHFYWDGGLMVLTAAYLLRRGYCCNSGCRHCPYRERGTAFDNDAAGREAEE